MDLKHLVFISVQTTILVLQLNQVIRVGVIQRGWSRRIFVFVPNNLQKNRYPNHALISQCYQNFSQSTTTTTRTTTTTIRAAATAITTNILQKKPGQRHSRRSPPQLIIEVTSHCGVHMIFVLGGAAGGREAFKSILFSLFYWFIFIYASVVFSSEGWMIVLKNSHDVWLSVKVHLWP